MIKIKINGFVDKEISTEEEAIAKAIEKVEKIDRMNSYSKDVLTKLYFIAPKAGVIVVAISEDDKEVLKVDSQVLAVTQISEYPLTKLPNQLLVYKEVIANKHSMHSFDDLMNAAQAITDRSDENLNNKKITVTKVIDYRNDEPSTLVLNSVFGDNIFLSTDAVLNNSGDADAGEVIVNSDYNLKYMRLSRMSCPKYHTMLGLTVRINGENVSKDDTNWHDLGGDTDSMFVDQKTNFAWHEHKISGEIKDKIFGNDGVLVAFNDAKPIRYGDFEILYIAGSYWQGNQVMDELKIELLDENKVVKESVYLKGLATKPTDINQSTSHWIFTNDEDFASASDNHSRSLSKDLSFEIVEQ